jgi:hypothetical protein
MFSNHQIYFVGTFNYIIYNIWIRKFALNVKKINIYQIMR